MGLSYLLLQSISMVCSVCTTGSTRTLKSDFEAGYRSLKDLPNTTRLENTESLELEWKEEMLQKEILPVDYDVCLKLWSHLCLVAGNRDTIRPCLLRVGAGAALDSMIIRFPKSLDPPLTIHRPSYPSFTKPSDVQLNRMYLTTATASSCPF